MRRFKSDLPHKMRFHPIIAKVIWYLTGFSKISDKEIAKAMKLSEYEVAWAMKQIVASTVDIGEDRLLKTKLARHKGELAIIETRRIQIPDGINKYLQSLGPYNELLKVELEKDDGLIAVETYKDGRVMRIKLEKGKILDYILGDEPCPWVLTDPENLLRLKAIKENKGLL